MGGLAEIVQFMPNELGLRQRCVAEFPVLGRVVFDMDGHPPGQLWPGDVMGCGGFYSSATTIGLYRVAFGGAPTAWSARGGDDHEVVGEHRGANEHRKALGLRRATLHAATAHQHRDATLDAGAKALVLLELRRPFVGLALRRFGAATLRNAYRLDGPCTQAATFCSLKKPRSAP